MALAALVHVNKYRFHSHGEKKKYTGSHWSTGFSFFFFFIKLLILISEFDFGNVFSFVV